MDLKKYIAEVQDYPKEGISFKDITPLIGDGEAFKYATKKFSEFAAKHNADLIVGPDARGFIFGCPVSYELGIGFVPVRKPGKLPREVLTYDYDLEYGSNTLCIHKDGIKKGQRVVVVDDLLATGGTMNATIKMVEQLGGIVVGLSFLIELEFLSGREKIGNYPIQTLISYK